LEKWLNQLFKIDCIGESFAFRKFIGNFSISKAGSMIENNEGKDIDSPIEKQVSFKDAGFLSKKASLPAVITSKQFRD